MSTTNEDRPRGVRGATQGAGPRRIYRPARVWYRGDQMQRAMPFDLHPDGRVYVRINGAVLRRVKNRRIIEGVLRRHAADIEGAARQKAEAERRRREEKRRAAEPPPPPPWWKRLLGWLGFRRWRVLR